MSDYSVILTPIPPCTWIGNWHDNKVPQGLAGGPQQALDLDYTHLCSQMDFDCVI